MSTFDATPTTPEGSYWEFLQLLWQAHMDESEDGGPAGWRGAPIAEIAFFRHGFVRAWYFTARDGTLKRKMKKSLSVVELAKQLCKGKPLASAVTPVEHDPGEVVALAVFGPGGIMDLPGRRGSSVAALERDPLCWLLDGNYAERRHELQAVVKYVRPRGDREAVLRFDWRAQVSSYELRSAMAPLQAGSSHTIVPAYQRMSTHGPVMYYSQKERHVSALAVREASAVCAGLAAKVVEADVSREDVRICADFKLLGGDRIVLLWASREGPEEIFPMYAFPSSMASAKLPKEMQIAPPRAPVSLGVLQPQPRNRQGGDADGGDGPGSARGSGSLSARAANPIRKVPGIGLMCSQFFVCRGCGRSEPRKLALQPTRDAQAARAVEVFAGEGAAPAGERKPSTPRQAVDDSDDEDEDDCDDAPRLDGDEALRFDGLRPQSAVLPAIDAARRSMSMAAHVRPTTATVSQTARLASPRLLVRADAAADGGSSKLTPFRGTVPGWNLAAMCADCAEKERAPRLPPRRAEKLRDAAKLAAKLARAASAFAPDAAAVPSFATLATPSAPGGASMLAMALALRDEGKAALHAEEGGAEAGDGEAGGGGQVEAAAAPAADTQQQPDGPTPTLTPAADGDAAAAAFAPAAAAEPEEGEAGAEEDLLEGATASKLLGIEREAGDPAPPRWLQQYLPLGPVPV